MPWSIVKDKHNIKNCIGIAQAWKISEYARLHNYQPCKTSGDEKRKPGPSKNHAHTIGNSFLVPMERCMNARGKAPCWWKKTSKILAPLLRTGIGLRKR